MKINPEVAKIPLEYGYPSSPLEINNCLSFLPALKIETNHILWKLAGRIGINKKADRNYKKNMAEIKEITNLKPEEMKTINIFDKEKLISFLNQAKSDGFKYTQFYENIFSVEAILKLLSS